MTLVYTWLALSAFLGATALVVDMGQLYTRRAQAQRAADAAALAGALDLDTSQTAAEEKAIEYAKLNGYDKERGDTVSVTFPGDNRVRVAVQRSEPLYFLPAFAALLNEATSTSKVGAAAVAQATISTNKIEKPILYGASYGKSRGGYANPSVFGQDGLHEHGDSFSPLKRLSNGSPPQLIDNLTDPADPQDEPRGANFPGYDYAFSIGPDYVSKNGTTQVQLEIFDPDSHVSDPNNMLGSWDEIHRAPDGSYSYTTTTYTLLNPAGTVIATASYGDDDTTNLKWTTPTGFTFDINSHGGPGQYKLRVQGGPGSSENGFQLRAGKPHDGLATQDEEDIWVRDYNGGGAGNGTSFTSQGKAVINFTQTGPIEINLGFVPKGATDVIIDKFDTDVGFQSMAYSIKKVAPGGGPSTETFTPSEPLPSAQQALNGKWVYAETVKVPSNYPAEGAYWFVSYSAGAYDTSNWRMNYSRPDTSGGDTVAVRLVD